MNTTQKKIKGQPALMPRLVADDNGYADHKIAWFDQNGKIMTMKVPSLIQVGGQGLTDAQGSRIGAYQADGTDYTCSSAVTSPIKLRSADYPVSAANRVLFTHALTKAGLLGMPVQAAVTLPFRDLFKDDGSINTQLRQSTQDNFMRGNVEVVGSEAQPEVVSVNVFAEALSAWFDWAFEDNGELSDGFCEMRDFSGEMLVVDIGGSTTDLASLQMVEEGGESNMVIHHGKSGTEAVGVIDAKAKLEELICAALAGEGVEGLLGHAGKIPAALVERVMIHGGGNFAGRSWDFSKQREQACKDVAQRITAFIRSRVGNPAGYFKILVVGGGAIVFQPWIKAILPNAVFSDEFANARGALKFLRDQRPDR